MKDLNDLMQAILDMDATQRKAAAAATAERTERLGRLDEERRAIAAEYAARARASGQAAAAAAEAANRAALDELSQRRAAAEQQLDAAAAAHRTEWVEELVRRTLEQPAAEQPRAGGEA